MVVILSGPKHSGKTSAGRALAALTAGIFADLDEELQTHTGKSPRSLYREGPGVFQAAEAAALGRLLGAAAPGGAPRIIAAGGGLIDNSGALALLEHAGAARTVYIEVSAETAWGRISREAETNGLPPFLDVPRPQEAHRALHERRAAAYRAWAGVTVRGEGKTPEEIAGEIAGRLEMR